MAQARRDFTTPVGRFVNGNLYKPQTKDADGKPLLIKNGPNTGQPAIKYYLAIAIPKVPGQPHWATYPRDPRRPDVPSWGEAIWAAGHEAFAGIAQNPAFAWKVSDGDSTIPNKKGRKPCDNEGWAGCWILHCGGSFAPKCYNADGTAGLPDPDTIKPGYYIQIAANVIGNNSQQNPGVYMNPSMVSLQAYGPEIVSGPDASAAGFGGNALPPGASAMPVGGAMPAPAPAGVPPLPPAGHPVHAPPPPGYTAPTPPAPVPVTPHTAFVTPPPAPLAPFPLAPPAGPAHVMLPAANGHSYEALIAAGWNDVNLRAAGMMQ